jgi:hypothetical protein
LEDLGVDNNNIKLDITEAGYEDVGWIHLDQDRVHRRAVVNTVMNIRVPQKACDLLIS